MEQFLVSHEHAVYGVLYFGAISIVALWELGLPRRSLVAPLRSRWFTNFGLAAIYTVLVAWLLPVIGVGFLLAAKEQGWGYLYSQQVPYWLSFAASLLIFDFSNYVQHFCYHHIPVLWRFHEVHHSDPDYDFTTGFRFHPVETVITFSSNLTLLLIVGAPALAFLVYKMLQVVHVMFAHGNIRLSLVIDRYLRLILVTPDMHRVHHSVAVHETNSNFGSLLTWWDRMLGTYVAQPANGHERMVIGLAEIQDPKNLTLNRVLFAPFYARA
jgi:sterol desaturase/sphingolipid hydroxylase (fatty acid hydroxylase superfamily)